eukprot:TRINITY_DN1020_c1_g1_i1.p1 TRINITY_DN1020_c1_g1~~TRINITY_DN1020_c1_g1_i1.p1  ORF type:complete len:189 (-),score=41.02 TRINITY_DN1020_c1_g1_i1:288-854(-)
MRMVLRLGESLVEQGKLDMEDVARRYYDWFRGPPYDVEEAFDSGPTWAKVFAKYKEGKVESLYEASKEVNSWGVNSCHRALPLACCGFLSESEMIEATKREGSLTHSSPVAVDASVAYVIICRALIEGKPVKEAILKAKDHVKELEVKRMLVTEFDFTVYDQTATFGNGRLFCTGKASEVLYDSMYFI